MRVILNFAFAAIVLLLFGSSAFFTARVVLFKRGLRTDASVSVIKSGQQARVVTIVDGDDLVVQTNGETVRVRILGVYTYDPTLSDPLVTTAARQTVQHLEQALAGKEIELVFDELKYDAKRRLLCYVHRGEQDLGLEMVSKGLALAYTKYPFSRMGSYVFAEDQAREAKVGLWADPQLAQRSRQLRTLWETQRRDGD